MSDVSGNTSNQQESRAHHEPQAQHKSQARSEQWTAIASTLVAIAILAAGVTASQHRSASPAVDEVVQWEEDLRFQINSVFRHDARARDKRLAQVDTVMRNWQASKQTAGDRSALLEWLTDATVRSMPGSVKPLAPMPEFGKTETTQVVASLKNQVGSKPAPNEPLLEAPALTAASNPVRSDAPSVAAEVPVTPTPQPDIFDTIELRQPQTVNRSEGLAHGPEPTLAPPPEVPGSEREANSPELASASNGQTALKPVVPEAEVRVNLTELAARIAGYHDALDQVELSLLRAEQPTAKLLADNLDRLENLSADYQFVTLYFATLSDEEQKGMLAPRSLEPTLVEVARHLEHLENVTGDDFLLFDNAENEQLTELKGRLERLQESLRGN